ncbi:MAG: hypothetical protein HYR96_14260 [Deltaproteobacteria bacterium]|nr:hypothetical protein [Deltaproteobacteria bacterium]MBI3296324.1 hypothetical protein [Deltaproteobacteria bacterium]
MENTQQKSALSEIWQFARTRKKFWLLPILIVLLTLGLLLFLVEGSALSPFVYTLF